MVIRGRIEKGVVVLAELVSLPEGTEVMVWVRAASEVANERALAAERSRVLAIMDAIAALPIEGAGEPFSGADHDKALYSGD
jgi:predicted DNA-binding antitoxin AbrB/MazE fold protein